MFKALSYIQSVPYECGDFKHRLCSSAFPIWWLCKLGQVPVCLSFLFLKMRRRIVANIDGCHENWIFIYLEYLMKCVILFEIFKVMKSKIKEVLKVKKVQYTSRIWGQGGTNEFILNIWNSLVFLWLHSFAFYLSHPVPVFMCVERRKHAHLYICFHNWTMCC